MPSEAHELHQPSPSLWPDKHMNTGFQAPARSYKHLVPQLRKMKRLQADGLRAIGPQKRVEDNAFHLNLDLHLPAASSPPY